MTKLEQYAAKLRSEKFPLTVYEDAFSRLVAEEAEKIKEEEVSGEARNYRTRATKKNERTAALRISYFCALVIYRRTTLGSEHRSDSSISIQK